LDGFSPDWSTVELYDFPKFRFGIRFHEEIYLHIPEPLDRFRVAKHGFRDFQYDISQNFGILPGPRVFLKASIECQLCPAHCSGNNRFFRKCHFRQLQRNSAVIFIVRLGISNWGQETYYRQANPEFSETHLCPLPTIGLFPFRESKDVPPEEFAPLTVLHCSFFGFHSCAIRCASDTCEGVNLEAATSLLDSAFSRFAFSDAGYREVAR